MDTSGRGKLEVTPYQNDRAEPSGGAPGFVIKESEADIRKRSRDFRSEARWWQLGPESVVRCPSRLTP
jgi:hypothetical protein